MGTKEFGNMLKRLHVVEESRIPAEEAREWKSKDKKDGLLEMSIEGCGMSLRSEVSWHKKRLWHIPKEKCWKTEEPFPPKEDGNQVREYWALHEENFLRSWLREDVDGRKQNQKTVFESGVLERMKRQEVRQNGRSEREASCKK